MFFVKTSEILMANPDNRGDEQASLINGGVRFFIFKNTIDFSKQG